MSQPLPSAPAQYDRIDQNTTRQLLEQELVRLRAYIVEIERRLRAAGIP
jgi:hypothetical protein